MLVAKDEDFQRLSVWSGAPPKVIWIRLGNCSTREIAQLHRARYDIIQAFETHEDATFLALG